MVTPSPPPSEQSPPGTATGHVHGNVALEAITKSFGPNRVLKNVSITFHFGEIHALVGQNGAGKSTLGKILGGLLRPDHGTIRIGGQAFSGWSARQALAHGVATIQQELSLVPDRTVAENVFLGIEPHRFGVLRGNLCERFDALEAQCRFGLDPRNRVGDLRIADRQKVEIMRAIARNARVVVMDEPTSSLTADEVDRLHTIIDGLRSGGTLIIYVTHSLSVVMSTCDRLSILRDGTLVRTAVTKDESAQTVVEGMLGKAADITFATPSPLPRASDGPPALELRGVRGSTIVQDVSLIVRRGEIVGLAGLVGSGRTEVADIVCGLDPLTNGDMRFGGQVFSPRSVRESIAHGIALIPEDRKRSGLVYTQSVQRNIGLPAGRRLRRFGVVSGREERRLATGLVKRLSITPNDVTRDVLTLSGGNQQKTLFAKWMTTKPRIIILDEPTRGVDVGARMHIYELIRDLAREGVAVLLISSDLEEVFGLSHRVYLIREGRTIGEVDPRTTSLDEVIFRLFNVARAPGGIAGEEGA